VFNMWQAEGESTPSVQSTYVVVVAGVDHDHDLIVILNLSLRVREGRVFVFGYLANRLLVAGQSRFDQQSIATQEVVGR